MRSELLVVDWLLVLKRNRYQAVVELKDLGDVRCDHQHQEMSEALTCATAILERLQQGAMQPRELPRASEHAVSATTSSLRADVPRLGPSAFAELCEIYGGRCRYCGLFDKLERDHAVPMARGGENWAGNVVPACSSCNRLKGVATEDEYIALIQKKTGWKARHVSKKTRDAHKLWATDRPRELRSVTLFREVAHGSDIEYLTHFGKVREAHLAAYQLGARPQREEQLVKGVTFYQPALRSVIGRRSDWEGRALLVPTYDNDDPTAVQVRVHGQVIGYVDRAKARQIHPKLVEAARVERAAAARCRIFWTNQGTARIVSARLQWADPFVLTKP